MGASSTSETRSLLVKRLGLTEYIDTWQAMKAFTDARDSESQDELWLVEHAPVFTQGQAGKPEHVLFQSNIPVVQTDRGGQVTYHGPGQLVAYPLLDLKRLKIGVRELVTKIECSVVAFLASMGVEGAPRANAPGVYVDGKKVASLGLRVRKGCSFHGVAINICTDLTPFLQINPCGYEGLEMVNLEELVDEPLGERMPWLMDRYAEKLATELGVELTCSSLESAQT